MFFFVCFYVVVVVVVVVVFKIKYFLNAKYAEIHRAGDLEADFKQVRNSVTLIHFFFFFSEIFTILLYNINNSKSAKKSKKIISYTKVKKKITLL